MYRSRIECCTCVGMLCGMLVGSAALSGQDRDIRGTYHVVSYPGSETEGELIYGVEYTVWLPPRVKQLRGVLVHQHGCGVGACKGGATAAYDLHWQALAKKWDCALLGPSYAQPEGADCRRWCDPRLGSNQTYLRALEDLARKSRHPELATVPWCLWGHSGGGYWASLMQTLHPDRIIAIWFRSGTAYARWNSGEIDKPDLPEQMFEIPMMANPGIQEKGHERFKSAWDGLLAMFQAYRARGAPIGFAPDPRTSHQCGDSRYLAIPFFDACLELRLPEPGQTRLKQVDQARAWLAHVHSTQAVSSDKFRGSVRQSVWLPNERIARAWQQYVVTGATRDTTPPPAPSVVTVSHNNGQSLVRWQAEADLESGIRQFVIRRDGQDVARIPESPKGRFGRPLFQSMSYHDTPETPLPEMQWKDEQGDATATYTVRSVNSVGLESLAVAASVVKVK